MHCKYLDLGFTYTCSTRPYLRLHVVLYMIGSDSKTLGSMNITVQSVPPDIKFSQGCQLLQWTHMRHTITLAKVQCK